MQPHPEPRPHVQDHRPDDSHGEAQKKLAAAVPEPRLRAAFPVRDRARDHAFIETHDHEFHAREFRALDEHERERWRRGIWANEWHYGRRGWWWQVGGVWYPYAVPVYPYPESVEPPVAYDSYRIDNAMGPSGAIPAQPSGQTLPPAVASLGSKLKGDDALSIARLPAMARTRYSCGDPVGDYPDIRTCSQPWTTQNADSP